MEEFDVFERPNFIQTVNEFEAEYLIINQLPVEEWHLIKSTLVAIFEKHSDNRSLMEEVTVLEGHKEIADEIGQKIIKAVLIFLNLEIKITSMQLNDDIIPLDPEDKLMSSILNQIKTDLNSEIE